MAPTAQKPLVGQFDWPAMNPPQNSSRPLHHSHSSHYESPFQKVDMRPSMLQSTTDFFSRHFAACTAHLSRQPVVLTVFLVACAIALLALALFLCGAKRSMERQERLHQCRHHYSDDGDDEYCCDDQDQGFVVCEKGDEKAVVAPGPAPGESLWSETRREFGLSRAGAANTHHHAQGAVVSVKPDLPPFHVSVRLI